MNRFPAAILYDADGNAISSALDGSTRRLCVDARVVDGGGNGLNIDSNGNLRVISSTLAGTPINILSNGYLATSAVCYQEYVVPVGKTLRGIQFYTGGTPQNAASGACKAMLVIHDATANQAITTGDFETAGDVTAWAVVTGAFTAPSPDSNGTQKVSGAASMRWIYTTSATAHERKYTPAVAMNLSNWRYIRVEFYNDNQTGTTRTTSIVLTSGTSTRTYSVTGTLGTAPMLSNTWISILGDIDNPTSVSGTSFDISKITAVSVKFIDANSKSGTVYWDRLCVEDALMVKARIYSSNGSSVSVPVAPEAFEENTALYLKTKNVNNSDIEFCTVLCATLE